MLRNEISEAMKGSSMYDVAEKLNYNLNLSTEEKEAFELCDAWVREIAATGRDSNYEIQQWLQRTIQEEVYEAPNELLDSIFARGSIGEFDAIEYSKIPKNTLIAHEAAKGGTVDASWIDFDIYEPQNSNRQVETNLSYADMRKNGFKSVAQLSTFAVEALQNSLYWDIFKFIDDNITGGTRVFAETGSTPTQTNVDKLTLYLNDRNPSSVAVTLTKYAQAIGRMTGYKEYASEKMRDDFNRYGLVKFIDGVNIASISGAKRFGSGSNLLIPDKRIFGVAGQIGNLDTVGEVIVYEDSDNRSEKLHLKFANFSHNFIIHTPENICKITLT